MNETGKLSAGRRHLLLFLVLGLAALVRAVGIRFGLPYPYANIDEAILTDRAMAFFEGDWNPHYFAYPTLYFYLQAAALGLVGALGVLLGVCESFESWRLAYYVDPSAHLLAGRALTAAFGVAAVAATHALGREIGSARGDRQRGERLGQVAALILAVNFLHAHCSRYITVDVPLSFFAAIAILYSVRHARHGRARHLLLAAVAGGLAASTKYYGALLAVPIAVAAVARAWGASRERRAPATAAGQEPGAPPRPELPHPVALALRGLLLAAAAMIAAFIAGSPYIALDFGAFAAYFRGLVDHMAGGHAGQEVAQSGYRVYLEWLAGRSAGPYTAGAAGLGLVLALAGRPTFAAGIVLASFPVCQYLMVSSFAAQFEDYLVPPMPAIAVLAALGITSIAETALKFLAPRRGSGATAGPTRFGPRSDEPATGNPSAPGSPRRARALRWATAILVIPFSIDATRCLQEGLKLERPDTRVLLREWAARSLPHGTLVATDTWLELPLTLECLELIAARRREADRGLPPDPGRPLRAFGPLTSRHVEARLAAARSDPPTPGYDMALLLPQQIGPNTLRALRKNGFRWLILASNRFDRILRNPVLDDPELLAENPLYGPWADFYRHIESQDLIAHKIEPDTADASGPRLWICDLDRSPPDR